MTHYHWNYFINILRIMLGIVIRSFLVFLFLLLLSYFNCSIYDFPEAKPFSGSKIHNPYAGLDSSNWFTGNFHVHGNAWHGLTNGKGTNEDLRHAYLRRLEYDLLGISNYQQIDEMADGISEIRTYEHGYSPTKNHQIVLGAGKVCWKEYPLYQSVHHKQHILRHLKEADQSQNLVAIAHPKRGMAYSLEDMEVLTDYDCIEAFNHLSTSRAHWDAALSAGHAVYLLSNDDCHDYEHLDHVGRQLTVVNLEELNAANAICALKEGKSYGVEVRIDQHTNYAIRSQKIKTLERIEKIAVQNEVLTVQFRDTCDTIRFIGQNGLVKKIVLDTTEGQYHFTPEDTYIRTEVRFNQSKHVFYFNPVFRYDGKKPVRKIATENRVKTIFYRIFIALCMLFIIAIFFLLERNRWRRAKSNGIT